MDKKNNSLSQTERNKRWQEKNRERSKYLRSRSSARGFIKNHATLEDIHELEGLIKDQVEQLKG